ncbi:MAG TPA: NAD(P)H-binding protein, partial [Anaerolineae bacterium]|nr:NAD(P)H-binding protein [Anaerolineae bacterium]
MKIAIIGGAGRSGQLLIDRALASGYEVTTFVRDRSKIAIQHDRLKIVEGDVRDLDRVNAAIQNQAAVISVLGQTRPPTKELLTIGVGNILKAMQQNNVTRLVYLTGAGVRSEKDSAPPIAAKVMMFLLKKMAADVLQDSEQAAELIKRSDREWIIVRVP